VITGRWRLAEGFEERLRELGERGDIVRTMQQELKRQGLERPATDLRITHASELDKPLVGKLIARGLSDEYSDRRYLIIDALDGRTHYIDIGQDHGVAPLPEGLVVQVTGKEMSIRQVDRAVAEIAAAHRGQYSSEIHLHHDPQASEEYIAAHIRRLEALRRTDRGIDRDSSGMWTIPGDYLERAGRHDSELARKSPARIEALAPCNLGALVDADGATWLDRQLVSDRPKSFVIPASVAKRAARSPIAGSG
jgi:hypothetical protein